MKITRYLFEIYDREHCLKPPSGIYLKSIVKLGLPPSRTIFIDDSALQMKLQPSNGIIIKQFQGDVDDKALFTLIPFLRKAAKVNSSNLKTKLSEYI
jgi:hypothetical protein